MVVFLRIREFLHSITNSKNFGTFGRISGKKVGILS